MTADHIAIVPKNSREDVRVQLAEFKGNRLVDVRIYADTKGGGRGPTPKGVSLKVDDLPALIAALHAAQAVAASAPAGYA